MNVSYDTLNFGISGHLKIFNQQFPSSVGEKANSKHFHVLQCSKFCYEGLLDVLITHSVALQSANETFGPKIKWTGDEGSKTQTRSQDPTETSKKQSIAKIVNGCWSTISRKKFSTSLQQKIKRAIFEGYLRIFTLVKLDDRPFTPPIWYSTH